MRKCKSTEQILVKLAYSGYYNRCHVEIDLIALLSAGEGMLNVPGKFHPDCILVKVAIIF